MIKALERLKRESTIFVLVELLLLLGVTILYGFDLFNIRLYLTLPIIFIIAASLMFINAFGLFIQAARIARARSKHGMELTGIIGGDVSEAYNFGMVGIVVVDHDFNVIWASEIFNDRRLSIIDKNILTWKPELTRLVELSDAQDLTYEDTIKIEIDSRNYEVKYLSKTGLFLFKDVTEFEYLFENAKENELVLGLVTIDNYNDIAARRELANPITGSVINEIYEYFRTFGALVKQYRDDAFLVILSRGNFNKMLEDKFSLLEHIKVKTEELEYKTTLSIGFGLNFPDVLKLNELVLNALDTAMARGGDQVVIARHGEENEYFGGTSSLAEKRNRATIRLYTDTIFRHIREAKNVIIMTHTQTDLDALGASVGLKALADYVKRTQKTSKGTFIPAKIVYSPAATEGKTLNAIHRLFSKLEIEELFITPEALEEEKGSNSLINSQTLLLVADVSRPSMTIQPKLLERIDKIIIIDHHRRTDDFIDNRIYDYIETKASSTSEIVTELMFYGNTPEFKLSSKFATLMLSGIYLDTNYFRSNTTGSRTFLASMVLEDWGAEVITADDFLKDELEEYTLITKIMASLKTLNTGVALLRGGEGDYVTPETISKVANQSMRIKGIRASFVIGYTTPNVVKVSGRSDGSINVQMLLEKLGGGGHQASAAAVLENKTLDEAEALVVEMLDLHLAKARVDSAK